MSIAFNQALVFSDCAYAAGRDCFQVLGGKFWGSSEVLGTRYLINVGSTVG